MSNKVQTMATNKLTAFNPMGYSSRAYRSRGIDRTLVTNLAQEIKEYLKQGKNPVDEFKPIVVLKDKSGKWEVVDGNHRLDAFKKEGIKNIRIIEKTFASVAAIHAYQSVANNHSGKKSRYHAGAIPFSAPLPKRYTTYQKMVNKYDQWYGADEAKKEVFEKLSKVVNAIGEGETITREQLASVFATTLDIPSEYVKDFLEDCLEFLTHKQIK